jgi:hypothetical protein
MVSAGQARAATERRTDLFFANFFGEHPLCVYARERAGQWVAAVGSSRIPGVTTTRGAYSFNKGYHWVDMSKVVSVAGVFRGPVRVHVTPDAWVPSKQLGFTVDLDVEFRLADDGTAAGTYRVVKVNSDDPSAEKIGKEGAIAGSSKPYTPPPMPAEFTLALNIQGALVGGDAMQGARALALHLGFKGGALASAFAGRLTPQGESHAMRPIAFRPGDATCDADGFKASTSVPGETLDGAACVYTFDIEGRIMESFALGAFKLTATPEGGQPLTIDGCFDGRWQAGMRAAEPAPASKSREPWWVEVKGFVAPAPGEHPRLLFRKGDVPALRAKAQTPLGKEAVARLKFLLGGGEAMPTEYNRNPPVNIGPQGPGQLKPGAFTVSHAAGFGLLYQLTGDAKYADLARQCLDKVFEGQVDLDERYSWKRPGTGFRLSYVHQAVAIAYDLCYEAWPEDYRQKVAREIQTNRPTPLTSKSELSLETLVAAENYPPASNHYGAYIAGPGFAALALCGDPGVDTQRMDAILARVGLALPSLFSGGFGDGGWFAEGTGGDMTSTQPGVAGLMQSLRVAAGQDWCSGRPHARMAILTRVLELVPRKDGVHRPARGAYAYGTGYRTRSLFNTGIGALPETYREGMAWVYENFFERDGDSATRRFETTIDPLTAVYAFVNWPEAPPKASSTAVFPLAVHDSLHGYVLCRNRLKDSNDCVFYGLACRGPVGYLKPRPGQSVDIWALGLRTSMGRLNGNTSHWQPGADGSACFTVGGIPWAVDYSGASGAVALIANVGGEPGQNADSGAAKAVAKSVKAGNHTYNVMLLCEGAVPGIAAAGDSLKIGGQTVNCDGNKIVLGTWAPVKR